MKPVALVERAIRNSSKSRDIVLDPALHAPTDRIDASFRVLAGEPPQPRRDDAVTAANKLAAREREQARLEAQEALDDPLVMAGRRLSGEAFAGEEAVLESEPR